MNVWKSQRHRPWAGLPRKRPRTPQNHRQESGRWHSQEATAPAAPRQSTLSAVPGKQKLLQRCTRLARSSPISKRGLQAPPPLPQVGSPVYLTGGTGCTGSLGPCSTMRHTRMEMEKFTGQAMVCPTPTNQRVVLPRSKCLTQARGGVHLHSESLLSRGPQAQA